MKGKKINGLYTFQGSTIIGAVAISTSKLIIETTRLWHMRIGHMSERNLLILSKRGLRDG